MSTCQLVQTRMHRRMWAHRHTDYATSSFTEDVDQQERKQHLPMHTKPLRYTKIVLLFFYGYGCYSCSHLLCARNTCASVVFLSIMLGVMMCSGSMVLDRPHDVTIFCGPLLFTVVLHFLHTSNCVKSLSGCVLYCFCIFLKPKITLSIMCCPWYQKLWYLLLF